MGYHWGHARLEGVESRSGTSYRPVVVQTPVPYGRYTTRRTIWSHRSYHSSSMRPLNNTLVIGSVLTFSISLLPCRQCDPATRSFFPRSLIRHRSPSYLKVLSPDIYHGDTSPHHSLTGHIHGYGRRRSGRNHDQNPWCVSSRSTGGVRTRGADKGLGTPRRLGSRGLTRLPRSSCPRRPYTSVTLGVGSSCPLGESCSDVLKSEGDPDTPTERVTQLNSCHHGRG